MNHDCTTSGCNGNALYGINLTCQCCFKPVFLECIQTRKEIVALTEAFEFGSLSNTSPFSGQHQLTNKIKNILFAQGSVFEFLCVKCKSNGNRFIAASETEKEYEAKVNELSNELLSVKQQLNDVGIKLASEQSKANELAAKLYQSNELIQQHIKTVQQMTAELTQLQHENSELQLKLDAATQTSPNQDSSPMDTEQIPTTMLSSYNQSICEAMNTSFGTMLARVESLMADQYRNLVDALGDNGAGKKRKMPNDTNGLNLSAPPFAPQSAAHNPSQVNTGSSFELEPPEERIKPKQLRSTYEIYVSKFKNTTTAQNIVQHIIGKSNIKDRDLFSVELMVKQKEKIPKLSYVSFKITTCSSKVNDELLKEEIWAPHFSAVPFSSQNEKVWNGQKTTDGNKNPKNSSQTPTGVNQHRSNQRASVGSNPNKRNLKVQFDENNGSSANTLSGTPSSSRGKKQNEKSEQNSNLSVNTECVSAVPPPIAPNLHQLPAFLGMPGLPSNLIHPLQYQIYQQPYYQQPQMATQHQQFHQIQQQPQHQPLQQQEHQQQFQQLRQ